MSNETPNDLERRVLNTLFEDDQALRPLRDQARTARVTKREFTGVGFFTEFVTDSTLPDASTSGRVLDRVVAAPPEGGIPPVGFLVFVEDGRLAMLEGYTTDDRWPDVGPDWSVTRIKVST